jgi:hypothetical protein
MPLQSKHDFFILGAAQFEANGCRDAIRMRNNLRDMDPHIMSGAGVGQDASAFHNCRDMKIARERIFP